MKVRTLRLAVFFLAAAPRLFFAAETAAPETVPQKTTAVKTAAPETQTPQNGAGAGSGAAVFPEAESNTLSDSRERLRLYEFGVEQTVLSPGKSGISSQVIADGERIVHSAYDSRMRLVRKLIWNVARDGEKPSVSIEYAYEDEKAAVPQKTVRTDTGAKLKTETWYSADFLPVREIVSVLTDVPDSANSASPRNQESAAQKKQTGQTPESPVEREWTYDGEKRITGETRKAGTQISLKTYSYSGVTEKPDTKLFQNGVLKEETVYRSETRREEIYYFSPGSLVRIEYEDEKKIAETYEINGKKVRETHFE